MVYSFIVAVNLDSNTTGFGVNDEPQSDAEYVLLMLLALREKPPNDLEQILADMQQQLNLTAKISVRRIAQIWLVSLVISRTSDVIQTPRMLENTSEAICQRMRSHLPLYIDEALEINELQLVHKHLAACSQCRKEVLEIKQTWQMLCELKDIKPQPDYIARLWSKMLS